MAKIYRRYLSLGCCSLLLATPSAQAHERLVLGSIQRPPISTPQQTGLADRVAIEAFKRIGKQLTIEDVPARRALYNANSGQLDGDLARIAGVTEYYPQLLIVPEPIWLAELVAFAKHSPSAALDWQQLSGQQLGYIRGWVVFEKYFANSTNITRVISPESLFRMLVNQRLEVALYEKKMGLQLAKSMQIAELEVLVPALINEPIYIYLHKKHQRLIPKLTEQLRQMKTDGSYQAIVRQTLSEILSPQQLIEYLQLQEKYDMPSH